MYAFVVVRGIVQLIFVTFLPLYLMDSGMSNLRVGAALSVFLATGSIGSLAGGSTLSTRSKRNAVLARHRARYKCQAISGTAH